MTTFNTNTNAFTSAIQQLRISVHGFTIAGVPKGSKHFRQQKRALTNTVSNTIDAIDTSDFGIRVIIVKTKE